MNYHAGILERKGGISFADVLGSSLFDALAVASAIRIPIAILGSIFVLGLLSRTAGSAVTIDTGGGSSDITVVILWFFALAASVRTIDPAFRMTVSRFFAFIGWWIVSALAIALGFVAFIVPGFWLLGRLAPTPYIALRRPQAKPLSTSWHSTSAWFWPTLALVLIQGIIASAINGPAQVLASTVSGGWTPLALVCGPVAFAVFAYTTIVLALATVRWTNELLLRSEGLTLTSAEAAGIVP